MNTKQLLFTKLLLKKNVNNARRKENFFILLLFTTSFDYKMMLDTKEITTKLIDITNLPIRLGQFLKLADLVQDGLEAKILIQQGEILVNGEVEFRRGKQLQEGDTIQYQQEHLQIITSK